MGGPHATEMRRVAQVAPHHVDEGGIALGRPDRGQVADQPDRGAGDPEAKAEPDGSGERAVDDRHRARRAAQQDRLGQRAMDRRIEAGDGLLVLHQTSAPPPNWKNDRKKRAGGEGDRQAEDDLDQPPEAAGGLAEGERQAGDDDDDHRDDLGDRTLDRIQDLLERLLPRHVGAGGMGRRGECGEDG